MPLKETMTKQNKIVRFTSELLSRPQLITPEAFAIVTEYLEARNSGSLDRPALWYDEDDSESAAKPKANYDVKASVGVLNVHGSLSAKPVMTMCGAVGTSYQALLEETQEMLDAGIKNIVMHVSSGGGEAYSCFTAVSQFRSMVDEAGLKFMDTLTEWLLVLLMRGSALVTKGMPTQIVKQDRLA